MCSVIPQAQDAAQKPFADETEPFVVLLKCLFSGAAFLGHMVHGRSLSRHVLSLAQLFLPGTIPPAL